VANTWKGPFEITGCLQPGKAQKLKKGKREKAKWIQPREPDFRQNFAGVGALPFLKM
jgi:hypothetical protein